MMVKRKQSPAEKSRPFTSINLYLPFKISICGTVEMQQKWKKFFGRKNAPSKDVFILENFRKDFNVKTNEDLFNDADSRRWDKKKIEGLLIELNYPTIQEYINFILDRAIEQRGE